MLNHSKFRLFTIKTMMLIISSTIILCSSLFAQSGWSVLNSGTNEALYSTYFIDANTGYTVGWSNAVLKSTNAGVNWFSQTIPGPGNSRLWSVFFTDVNTGYVAAGVFGGNVYKTSNGGNNWIALSMPVSGNYLIVSFLNTNTGYAAGFNSAGDALILKTTNSGDLWVSQNVPGGMHVIASVNFIDANTGFAAESDLNIQTGHILKTTNGGANWQEVFVYTNDSGVRDISFADANTGIAVCGGRIGSSGAIFRTTNGGNNWTNLNYNAGNTRNLWSVKFLNSSTGYIAGATFSPDEGIILKTTNGGLNWGKQNTNTSTYLTGCYFLNVNTGYVVGELGRILKTTDGGGNFVGIEPSGQEIPAKFHLYQNYPNPFNPATKIKFTLPKNSYAKLAVFDILGSEVATLVNEKLNHGTYEVDWDASGFPSGVYYYKLVVNQGESSISDPKSITGQVYTEAKKMILIK